MTQQMRHVKEWANTLREVHEDIVGDVKFVEKKWEQGLETAVEEHGMRYGMDDPKILSW